jgi:hypothetical protein
MISILQTYHSLALCEESRMLKRVIYSDGEAQWTCRRNPVSVLLLIYGSWKIMFRKCPLSYGGEEPLFFAGAEHCVVLQPSVK